MGCSGSVQAQSNKATAGTRTVERAAEVHSATQPESSKTAVAEKSSPTTTSSRTPGGQQSLRGSASLTGERVTISSPPRDARILRNGSPAGSAFSHPRGVSGTSDVADAAAVFAGSGAVPPSAAFLKLDGSCGTEESSSPSDPQRPSGGENVVANPLFRRRMSSNSENSSLGASGSPPQTFPKSAIPAAPGRRGSLTGVVPGAGPRRQSTQRSAEIAEAGSAPGTGLVALQLPSDVKQVSMKSTSSSAQSPQLCAFETVTSQADMESQHSSPHFAGLGQGIRSAKLGLDSKGRDVVNGMTMLQGAIPVSGPGAAPLSLLHIPDDGTEEDGTDHIGDMSGNVCVSGTGEMSLGDQLAGQAERVMEWIKQVPTGEHANGRGLLPPTEAVSKHRAGGGSGTAEGDVPFFDLEELVEDASPTENPQQSWNDSSGAALGAYSSTNSGRHTNLSRAQIAKLDARLLGSL